MGIHVKNIIHVDVYWKKTLSFDYESVKYTSMDVNKARLEYIGCQMAWINALSGISTATK